MTRSHLLAAALVGLLTACGAPELRDTDKRFAPNVAPSTTQSTQRAGFASQLADLPPMKRFTAIKPATPKRSNAQMTQDFLDLFFHLETGATLPVFTRFEGPVTLRVTGPRIPASVNAELGELMGRLRREAGIDITRVSSGDSAAITIELIPRAALRAQERNAACIAVPNVASWKAYRAGRSVSWTTLTTRERVAIFIPQDVAPQEIRDCLHEELAQALGPLNDLYRLPDSVFNDDNIHSVLTGFDMLMLRAAYAPELRSGMRRDQVAALLPTLVNRLNPAGRNGGAAPQQIAPKTWRDNMTRAIAGPSRSIRRTAAQAALATVRSNGWQDTRAGLAHYVSGLVALATDRQLAKASFTRAHALYASSTLTEIHAANVARHLAALALVDRDHPRAFAITNAAIPAATRAQDAALLASLMMIKAEALAQQGRAAEAQAVYLDSLGWARYGFGSDKNVAAVATEISTLAQQ